MASVEVLLSGFGLEATSAGWPSYGECLDLCKKLYEGMADLEAELELELELDDAPG